MPVSRCSSSGTVPCHPANVNNDLVLSDLKDPSSLMAQQIGSEESLQPGSPQMLDELSVLMQLRLAFGPGTRLWASRSREELCYEWLHYKAHRSTASFREFARMLCAQERESSIPGRCASDVIRRVVAVLRAHRIKRAPRMHIAANPRPAGRSIRPLPPAPGADQPSPSVQAQVASLQARR
jgi:hypothetical protein